MTVQPNTAVQGATSVRGARLARRLFGNYALQIVNLGIRLFDQLLLIPLYIFAWGTDLYRDWLVVTALIWFLNTCNLGVDEYFGNLFLRSAVTGNKDRLKREVRLGLFVSLAIATLILALLYGALLTTDIGSILTLSSMSSHAAALILFIMTAPLAASYALMMLHGIYRAYGDFSRGEIIFAIYAATQLACVVTALAFRQSPSVVALCYASMPIVFLAVMLVDVYRRYPEARLGLAIPRRDEWRQIIPQSLLYFTGTLSFPLTQNGPLLLFGLFDFSASAIVTFNVCRVFTGLTRMIGAYSFSIGSGIEMARQYLENDHASCRKLYADTGRIVACLAGLLSGLSIPMSVPFIKLWTHGAVAGDATLVLYFLIGIYFASPGRASLMLLRYTNHAYAIAIANSTYAIGGLALALALARPFGVLGVAAALALMEIAGVGLFPPIIVNARFGFGAMRHLLRSYFFGICVFSISYAVAHALFARREIDLAGMIVGLCVWAFIAVPLGTLFALTRAQRARLAAAFWRYLAPYRRTPPS